MNVRTLLLSAGLLTIVCGGVHSQPQPAPPAIPSPQLNFPPPPVVPSIPAQSVPTSPVPPAPPPEKTVEDLIKELERIHSQKAELAKKEQELKAMLGKKLELQTERLKKLGVTPKGVKEEKPQPDRVGRIIIEGNAKFPDRTILNLMALAPGEVLKYTLLEESRRNLVKFGFLGVKVEVSENELDPIFKDIRVKVIEPPEVPPAPPPSPRAPSGRG